jgi:hypothetical protein
VKIGTEKRRSVQERSKLGLRWGSVTWPNSRLLGQVASRSSLKTGFLETSLVDGMVIGQVTVNGTFQAVRTTSAVEARRAHGDFSIARHPG